MRRSKGQEGQLTFEIKLLKLVIGLGWRWSWHPGAQACKADDLTVLVSLQESVVQESLPGNDEVRVRCGICHSHVLSVGLVSRGAPKIHALPDR